MQTVLIMTFTVCATVCCGVVWCGEGTAVGQLCAHADSGEGTAGFKPVAISLLQSPPNTSRALVTKGQNICNKRLILKIGVIDYLKQEYVLSECKKKMCAFDWKPAEKQLSGPLTLNHHSAS